MPSTTSTPSEARVRLAWVQGLYFVVTGLWPLASMRTFEAVSGPKHDRWLVHTVGVLVAAIGATLCLAAARRAIGPEVSLLATGTSLGLATIDVAYVSRGRIRWVYLLDAGVEVALTVAWWASGQPSAETNEAPRATERSRGLAMTEESVSV